jgi:uncharacterized protein YkwD
MNTRCFAIVLLLIFYLNNITSQSLTQLESRLDSLNQLMNKKKNNLSTPQKSTLNGNIYKTKHEINRITKTLGSTSKSDEIKLPDAYKQNTQTRGADFIPFEDYSTYLKELNNTDCCNDITDWSYEYYSLSYNDFIGIKILSNQINFNNINYPLLHAAIFFQTNRQRELNGLPTLRYHHSLETAAFDHAKDMKTYKFFSHTSVVPGKENLADRISQAGFTGSMLGENIAITFGIAYKAGTPVYTPDQNAGYFSYEYQGDPIPPHTYLSFAKEIVTQWMNSPGHRENILNPNYNYLGTGTSHFKDSKFYMMDKFYGVQEFAK